MQGRCWPTRGCGCRCLLCLISNTPGKVRGSTPPQHLPIGGKLQKTQEIKEPRSQVFSTHTTDSPENSCGTGLGRHRSPTAQALPSNTKDPGVFSGSFSTVATV